MVLQVPPSYTEHAKEFPINPSNKVPERNSDRHNTDEDISRREFLKKAGMIAAGLIGAGAVGGGIGATIFGGKEKEPVATNPNVDVTSDNASEQNIPAEAKTFVEKYGDRYSDPVGTYCATEAYDKANGNYKMSVVLDDDYVEKNVNNTSFGPESELGFQYFKLSVSAEENTATCSKVFNEYALIQLNRYLNLLVKNPSPEARMLIDQQFINYCSDSATNHATNPIYKDQDPQKVDRENLMNTMKAIVAKFSSVCNFSIVPGAIGTRADSTNFYDGAISKGTFTDLGDQELNYFANTADLLINITRYTTDGVAIGEQLRVKNFNFSIAQHHYSESDSTTYIAIGQNSTARIE